LTRCMECVMGVDERTHTSQLLKSLHCEVQVVVEHA